MEKLELEMHRAKFRAATRYVTYSSQQLNAIDVLANLQLNIKAAGLTHETLPSKIKVTIEWEDVNGEVLKE
ncbi:MAG: hypothetical protein ACP5NL_07030 [Thermoplasmata archaeon]